MNVMDVARSIGLVARAGTISGTIEETKVLSALARMAETDPTNADLFEEAAARVRSTRSAGVEELDGNSRIFGPRDVRTIQLRYRAEMADIFTDLAIDVGLRQRRPLADVLAGGSTDAAD